MTPESGAQARVRDEPEDGVLLRLVVLMEHPLESAELVIDSHRVQVETGI